jgi:GT2 family glycosyltransferase
LLLIDKVWPGNPVSARYLALDVDLARSQDVEQPAAACLLVRREAFDAVGGFDHGYHPAWFEDVDFCRRLRARGLRVDYEPALRAMHREASGKPWVGERALAWSAENYVKFTRKHHGRGWALLVALLIGPVLVLRGIALFAYGLVTGSALHRSKGRSFVGVGARRGAGSTR